MTMKIRNVYNLHFTKDFTKLGESYHVFTTPTGFGSVFLAIFSVARPGDEIIVADPVYSPTRLLTQDFLKSLILRQYSIIQVI